MQQKHQGRTRTTYTIDNYQAGHTIIYYFCIIEKWHIQIHEHILYTIVITCIYFYTKASLWRPAVLPARPRVYSLLAAMVGTLLWHHTASLVLHHPSSTETTCTRTLCNVSKLASINFYVAHVIVYKNKNFFTDVHNAALLLTELLHTTDTSDCCSDSPSTHCSVQPMETLL